MGLAGMILTKETYIIHVGCALIAIWVTSISHKITPLPGPRPIRRTWRFRDFAIVAITALGAASSFYLAHWLKGVAAAASCLAWLIRMSAPIPDPRPVRQTWTYLDLAVMSFTGLAVVIFFYSGTFMNWPGVAGLWKCFEAWFKTGSQGAGHEKEIYYWLELILRYEQPVALGLLLCVACQFLRHVGLRYLAIYGVGTLLAYSIVKYKTPWCIISIAWPFLFIFGAFPTLLPAAWRRAAVAGAGVLLAISLGLSISLNYFRCSTFNEFNWKPERRVVGNVSDFYDWEPYVYVQTYNDVWKLTKPLLRLAKSNPTYYQMIGHLIRTSTYPLPWMLGDFTKVGYYEHNNMPDKVDGDFLLVQEDKIVEVEAKLHETYYTELMTIRPYQDYSKLYFNAKVFYKIFPGRVPEFSGKPAD
jgi:hypothetical protein